MSPLLSRLFASKHDEFADSLAREFIALCPPDAVLKPKKRKDSVKLLKAINRTHAAARAHAGEQKPGMYARARIGNELMWRLKDAGYDDVLAERVTKGVLLCLGGK